MQVLTPSRVRHTELHQDQPGQQLKEFIGGATSLSESPARRDITVIRARLIASRLLGMLCTSLSAPMPSLPEGVEPPLESIARILLFHLASKSAVQRLSIGMVVCEWAKLQQVGIKQ